ncbi:MAG: hypothetical protein WA753_13595, partial [Pseudolabrys sp.]
APHMSAFGDKADKYERRGILPGHALPASASPTNGSWGRMRCQFVVADHRALKSAIACLRVAEYP